MAFALGAAPSAASSSAEAELVRLVNAERANAGLRSLAVSGELVSVARGHSARMADAERIWHNPSLRDEVSNWESVGENVASGRSVRAIHDALMDSPTHRDNILLSRFTQIGVGVVTGDDGRYYVTQVFRLPMNHPAPAPAPAPARQPVPGVVSVAPILEPEAEARTASMLAQIASLD